jgi:glucose-1-phosphate thymidylyltransferase
LFGVLDKGVLVVPNTVRWTGPWLGATRRLSLQRVANRPIICHGLDEMARAGVADVAILLPDDAVAEISGYISAEGPPGVAVRYLEIDRHAGQAQALAAAAQFAGDDACVLHRANGLLAAPLAEFAQALSADSLDALLLVQDDGSQVRRLKLVPQRQLGVAEDGGPLAPAGAAGVCVLAAGALARAASAEAADAEHEPAGSGRYEQTLDFALLARQLARDGARVQSRAVQRWRQFTGDAMDLLDMNRTMLDRLDPEATIVASDGNRFEGAIAIHPTAHVSSSVIIGPAIIGAEALIADSYIGPHTSIGERVRIEGVELERSIVLADASVLHVGGRLVASVVGCEARVFRDFSMPRALRLHVGDGDEVALC